MQRKEARVCHRGYAAKQNKNSHKVSVYDTSGKIFYSCNMDNKATEEDLISLIDALVNYRNRLDLWG